MAYTVKQQIRQGLPQVGVKPYRQVHAHSTGNPNSTAQNEADYHDRRPVESGFFQYVVGDGVAIQTAPPNMGAYDVGGGWNAETFAAVELIESHKTRAEFERDYAIYCELLRDLANKGGIPVTLDTNDLAGIKTHNYCTHHQPNNFSDHVDPLPYLAKWGITLEQFRNDVCNSITSKTTTAEEQTIQKKKVGDIMLLFRNENSAEVYWLIGNKYTHIKSERELEKVKILMNKAGYDTWIHTDSDQIKYIKKLADEIK